LCDESVDQALWQAAWPAGPAAAAGKQAWLVQASSVGWDMKVELAQLTAILCWTYIGSLAA
jgi:hypothetical protein